MCRHPDLAAVRIHDVLVIEGDNGTTNAVFTVTLSGATNQAVSVDYLTVGETAVAGTDYISQSGRLTFQPGETTKTITVPVIGDTEIEQDEVFYVYLTNAVGGLIANGKGEGTIYNDDCRTTLKLAFFPGVTIDGCINKSYRIEVSYDTSGPWYSLTNISLPSSPYLWFDTISTNAPERFYRVFLLPP